MTIVDGGNHIEINRLSDHITGVKCPRCGTRFFIRDEVFKGEKPTRCTNTDVCQFEQLIDYTKHLEKRLST